MLELIPPDARKPYRVQAVVDRIVDAGDWLEIQPGYGASLVCGLAWIGGRSCAIVANNPGVRAGALDSAAAIKGAGFLESVGAFALPVIFLADNPGVMAGSKAEREGILKWAGRMFKAERRLRAPKIHVTLRKAFGFGSTTMAHNPFDAQTLHFSLPALTLSAMPARAGGESAKLASDAQERVERAEKAGPWRFAAGTGTDEVIDPRELRNAILAGLALAAGRLAQGPGDAAQP
jgi:acetyl-CoA carboxylase carboxyltransferase component